MQDINPTQNTNSTKKRKRPQTDTEKIHATHDRFVSALTKMPKNQRADIIAKIRDHQRILSILEQAEIDPSPVITEEQYQMQFFENTGWYYPDEEYHVYIEKDRNR